MQEADVSAAQFGRAKNGRDGRRDRMFSDKKEEAEYSYREGSTLLRHFEIYSRKRGADMHIVIEMPDRIYRTIQKRHLNIIDKEIVENAIRNGTPLPKGHGKLKDTDKISDELERLRDSWNHYGNEYESGKYEGYDYALDEVLNAPAIIEADKEE